MKPNDDKSHLIVCNKENLSVKLGNETIQSTGSVELPGITIDKRLNYTAHVSNLSKKGNQKLHALARISQYISEDKLKVIMRTFSQS